MPLNGQNSGRTYLDFLTLSVVSLNLMDYYTSRLSNSSRIRRCVTEAPVLFNILNIAD